MKVVDRNWLAGLVYTVFLIVTVSIVGYVLTRPHNALTIPLTQAAQAKLAACDGAKSIVLTLEDGQIVDAQVVCR